MGKANAENKNILKISEAENCYFFKNAQPGLEKCGSCKEKSVIVSVPEDIAQFKFPDLEYHSGCYDGNGKEYRGVEATTKSGQQCQPWKDNPGHWTPSRLDVSFSFKLRLSVPWSVCHAFGNPFAFRAF